MQYRYICAGVVDFDGPISDYRLLAGTMIAQKTHCIRVRIPADLTLVKYRCDSYATTKDTRSLNELGYDVLVRINGKLKVQNTLKGIQPHRLHEVLLETGLHLTSHGYFRTQNPQRC